MHSPVLSGKICMCSVQLALAGQMSARFVWYNLYCTARSSWSDVGPVLSGTICMFTVQLALAGQMSARFCLV